MGNVVHIRTAGFSDNQLLPCNAEGLARYIVARSGLSDDDYPKVCNDVVRTYSDVFRDMRKEDKRGAFKSSAISICTGIGLLKIGAVIAAAEIPVVGSLLILGSLVPFVVIPWFFWSEYEGTAADLEGRINKIVASQFRKDGNLNDKGEEDPLIFERALAKMMPKYESPPFK